MIQCTTIPWDQTPRARPRAEGGLAEIAPAMAIRSSPRRRGPSGGADELKPSIWIPACAGMSGESDRAFPDEAVANHASHFITAEESRPQNGTRKRCVRTQKKGAARRRPASICFPRRVRPRIWVSAQFGTAAFGLGGKAASLTAPRRRSMAIFSALSSFSSGGT